MIFEYGHPDTSLADWEAFRNEVSPHLVDKVIDRSEIEPPHSFVPLARGFATPSELLLRRVGHKKGTRPLGWRKKTPKAEYYHLVKTSLLMVKKMNDQDFWTIERIEWISPTPYCADVLVHFFGSTPILARSYQAAMRLAMYCHVNDPPSSLRWIKTKPKNVESAIEIARVRRINEVAEQLKVAH